MQAWYIMHSKVVWAHVEPIRMARQLAWMDWANTYDIDNETPISLVIDELHRLMTSEECQAFAPHNNTREDVYYSDSEFRRSFDLETAIPLARGWLRNDGAVRARTGHFNDTPVIDRLRQRELNHNGENLA